MSRFILEVEGCEYELSRDAVVSQLECSLGTEEALRLTDIEIGEENGTGAGVHIPWSIRRLA